MQNKYLACLQHAEGVKVKLAVCAELFKHIAGFKVLTALMLSAVVAVSGCDVFDDDDDDDPVTTFSGSVVSGSTALDEHVALMLTPTGGGTGVSLIVATDGTFSDSTVTVGTYSVAATRPGYEDFSQSSYEVVVGTANTLTVDMNALAANTYIGSEDCGLCHETNYASFIQTGHPFKINKVVNNMAPTYPFTDLDAILSGEGPFGANGIDDEDGTTDNTLGTPAGWSDVTYVIGGYNWKARFIDADGYIVTGSEVQYNFATDAFSSYHDDETDKVFNCGNCHTTGWRHQDDTLNNARQDNLAGMDGTFAAAGIQCESCHGAGSTHAQDEATTSITREADPRTTAELTADNAAYGQAVACGECHTRDGERDYSTYVSAFDTARTGASLATLPMGGRIAASGSLIRHHEQYDELLGIDPDTLLDTRSAGFEANHLDCGKCHDPHGSSVNQDNASYAGVDGVNKANADCMVCHATKDPSLRTGGMTSLSCTDCHMPDLVKNATSSTNRGSSSTIVTGDIATHIFTIDVNATSQFTSDGKYAYPAITADFACRTCHQGFVTGTAFELDSAALAGFVFHNN